MENMQQKLILMTPDGKRIGTASREECHLGEGRLHWGFIVLAQAADGRYILARRSDTKSCGAGLWDASVVSHVLVGETPAEAGKRRATEELGIAISNVRDIGAFVYTAQYGKYSENEYCSVLVAKATDMPHPNPEEISEVRLATFDQLVNDIRRDKYLYAPWLTIPVEKLGDKIKNS